MCPTGWDLQQKTMNDSWWLPASGSTGIEHTDGLGAAAGAKLTPDSGSLEGNAKAGLRAAAGAASLPLQMSGM